jgi:ABC-type Co2+ transport system permease subunit
MSNSIASAPAVLALGVIKALANKLPVLSGFSTVFTSSVAGAGKTIQVPLIGTSTATEFGASGYLTGDDATVTSSSVTLKHFKVSSRFSPLDIREYGVGFFANNFVETAAIALSQVCMDEINDLITNANYSSNTVTGADLDYADVVAAQKTLDDAKAPDKRALVLNNTYLSDLRSDATIIAAFQLGANVISTGSLGTIAGAQVYQFSNLAANSESLAGFLCGADAIAVATALPFNEIPGADVSQASDPATGLSVQVMIIQEQSGFFNVTATLLFGCAVGRATSLRRLKTA